MEPILPKSHPYNFASSLTHSDPITQEKIKYFHDCIGLLTNGLGQPNAPENINTKLFCKLILKLITSFNSHKRKYTANQYKRFGYLISPDYFIIAEENKQTFVDLNEKISNYVNSSINEPKQELKNALEEAILLLENKILSDTVAKLREVFYSKDRINENGQITTIENCCVIVISEFYAIGWTLDSISNLFTRFIFYSPEDFESEPGRDIYNTVVPREIYKFIDEPTESYKVRLFEYIKTKPSMLEVQLNNILFQYTQSQRAKVFIFKVYNVRLNTDVIIEYNDCVFSPSIKNKYPEFKGIYQDFIEPSQNLMFAEVSVTTGHDSNGHKIAALKLREALEYINFNVSIDSEIVDRSLRAYSNVSEFITTGKHHLSQSMRYPPFIKRHHIESINEIKTLELLSSHPAVKHYLTIDKIFFQAFSSENVPASNSNFWRYFETFFSTQIQADQAIEKLVKYLNKRMGLAQLNYPIFILFNFASNYQRSSEESSELKKELSNINNLNIGLTYPELLEKYNLKINHPLINRVISENLKYTTEEASEISEKYFRSVLKNINIQRNLYQHSNLIVQELENIYAPIIIPFMSYFRKSIIEDLIRNPSIKTINEIIN